MSDGLIIYNGPPDHSLKEYFQDKFKVKTPKYFNPADILVRIAHEVMNN
jgi:hypothetical protein